MPDYLSYNCTVIGQRYVEKGKPCEDCSASFSGEGIHIAIVADGHGDPKCFRSNIGSAIACEVALESMKTFALGLREQGEEHFLLREKTADKLVSQLFLTILGRWSTRVLEQLAAEPPTEEEYAGVDAKSAAIYRSGGGLTHIFGTTLIAMVMTERYLLVLHQGDGRCVVLHHDGTVDQPVPWDPRCEGRNTASLCDDDVKAHWRYHIIDLEKDPIVGCYAASDGVEDSFETMEETNAYIGMLTSEYVKMGREEFLTELPAHFSMLSRTGSQDDVSVGCILNAQAAAGFTERYDLMHTYIVAQGENRRARGRLDSMARKTAYLTQELEKARTELKNAEQERMSLGEYLERLRGAIAEAVKKMESGSAQTERARELLQQIQAEYDAHMDERREFEEKVRTTKETMTRIELQLRNGTENEPAAPVDAPPEAEDSTPVYEQPEEAFDEFEQPEEIRTELPEQAPDILREPEEAPDGEPEAESGSGDPPEEPAVSCAGETDGGEGL